MAQYRALISIPITADDDGAAQDAAAQAAALTGDGHVELVGEVPEDSLEIWRIVHAEALLLTQLPPDWKP